MTGFVFSFVFLMENKTVFDIINSLSLRRDLKRGKKIDFLFLTSPVLSFTSAPIGEADKITTSRNQE